MKTTKSPLLFLTFIVTLASAAEFHVAKNGSDEHSGSNKNPFLTIQAAADVAQPGDTITVHEGIYREKMVPPRGGVSDAKRITYRAAEGEKVHIKGSEVVDDWKLYEGTVWVASIPHSFFGNHNPYVELIEGDWFNAHDRLHHTGEVYINGKSLWEAASLENVVAGEAKKDAFDSEGSRYKWFCESDDEHTTIYANFHETNPNETLIEINVRDSCFYPAETGINYITISGFRMSQAATNWAAPTAEQIGLIGTFWSKGWIIENNVISDSKCSGITLGKDRKSGHNTWSQDTSKGGATTYNEMILRVLKNGWSKENIGSHIVRNNVIYNCEQTGMCGSFGAAFSEISGNHVYNIYRKRQFSGFEMAAIKFHGAVDTVIRNNVLHDAQKGMWLDWMTQGTRISGNVCYDNDLADLWLEVNHGPYLVDNNIFLSGIWDWSTGGAYAHNLIKGKIYVHPISNRYTPYLYDHSTELMGFGNISCGDNRFYNNIFMSRETGSGPDEENNSCGLASYNAVDQILPVIAGNNLYYNTASYKEEETSLYVGAYSPDVKVSEDDDGLYLELTIDDSFLELRTETVSTETLGITKMTHSRYENSDGSELSIDRDVVGTPRTSNSPTVGPVEGLNAGYQRIRIR